MKKESLFIWAVIFLISGLSLIGWGVGKLFIRPCEGIMIGFGCGLTTSAIVLLRLFRRRDAFEKK
ncbi:hypothetical protein I5907_00005 [Panacibacter sp. DH6]|uniref:Uncharacterized protein n=1 Tax=Panacibacter microcysteis TaxID=2793269 RepID=A0A931E3H5_9BACT|nr:hypothetical protein [Panacibacter microcysteis]MBG9374600.1 hypothetical protein [Panacibacter microcysteis]